MRKTLRPDAATRVVDGMKLHRRTLRLAGRPYTVVTLRAGTDVRFSTNYFHGTWHVLSDWHGARVLGRLLWGLAFQRSPGTMVLIDEPFLDTNPFDAEPPDPIALVPKPLTNLTVRAAQELRRRLPLAGAVAGTVRWRSYDLDAEIAQRQALLDRPVGGHRTPWIPPRGAFQARVTRLGGVLTLTATSWALRTWATEVFELGRHAYRGMDYAELDSPHGEIQVFRDYQRRVSAARVARREILAEFTDGCPDRDVLNHLIWQRGHEVRHQRRAA